VNLELLLQEPGKTYRSLTKKCATVNELNKIHILLENQMTPAERDALIRTLGGRGRGLLRRILTMALPASLQSQDEFPLTQKLARLNATSTWRQRLRKNRKFAHLGTGATWSREAKLPGLTFYRRTDIHATNLLISFTGLRQRMMMALPDWLDATSPLESDVVLLQATKGSSAYLSGIEGLGDTLENSLATLKNMVESLGYSKHFCVGSSAGGVPAILFSHLVQMEKTIAVGPQGPEVVTPEFEPTRMANLEIVIGENSPPQDWAAAQAWEALCFASTTVVADAGHSAMVRFVSDGKFLNP
jgi:hypothetical protein